MKLIARPEPTEFTSFGICWCSKARYKLQIGPEHARDLFKVSYTHRFIVRNPQSTTVNLAAQRASYRHLRNLEQWRAKDSDEGLPKEQGTCQLLPILSGAWSCLAREVESSHQRAACRTLLYLNWIMKASYYCKPRALKLPGSSTDKWNKWAGIGPGKDTCRSFFSEHMFWWGKAIFCANHFLDLQPGAGHAASRAVLQVASHLHRLWVAAGGSLSPPGLWSSLAPCPSLVITPSCPKNLDSLPSPSSPTPMLALALWYVGWITGFPPAWFIPAAGTRLPNQAELLPGPPGSFIPRCVPSVQLLSLCCPHIPTQQWSPVLP